MTDDDGKDDIMAETHGPASDANVAQTPLADLVANALERMEAGARMILDSIPGDSSLSSSSHSHGVTSEIARLCRIGASVMPRPISEANIETGSFIAFVDVTNNKTGENWTEKHLVWIDEDTGEIAIDCEQGWRLEDYHSFVPLSALPKPQVKP